MSAHNIPFFNMNKKNTINYPKSTATGFFSKGLKNEFETAVVNEPSVFEPSKFDCNDVRRTFTAGYGRKDRQLYMFIQAVIMVTRWLSSTTFKEWLSDF